MASHEFTKKELLSSITFLVYRCFYTATITYTIQITSNNETIILLDNGNVLWQRKVHQNNLVRHSTEDTWRDNAARSATQVSSA